MNSAPTSGIPDISKFYHAVKVLEEFDCAEMRGVIKGILSPNERETCFIGTYYRVALNVRSLLELDNPTHFQAISQLARTIFELSTDIRLIDLVVSAPAKIKSD